MHQPSSPNGPISLKQVEFNTISVSFGGLSSLVSSLHRSVLDYPRYACHLLTILLLSHLYNISRYYDLSPLINPSNIPPNDTAADLAKGLAEAHRAYNVEGSCIMMVVQEGERNVFDQRYLEYNLHERYVILSYPNYIE
jgi:glutathione synthase